MPEHIKKKLSEEIALLEHELNHAAEVGKVRHVAHGQHRRLSRHRQKLFQLGSLRRADKEDPATRGILRGGDAVDNDVASVDRLPFHRALERRSEGVGPEHTQRKNGGVMTMSEMQELARLGAYLEFVWALPGSDEFKKSVKSIRALGPEFCLISSDLGNPKYPVHPAGVLELFQYYRQGGLSEQEIDLMAKVTPAKLLGLK